MPLSNRIDGWKAIGAHFGRDRTTAMRWAQARGLPVRRIPGGKTATVYALRDELDRWAHSQSELETGDAGDLPQPQVKPQPGKAGLTRRHLWLIGGSGLGAVVLGAVVIGGLRNRRGSRSTLDLPSDPALSDLYLQARDDWAKRTPESLVRAMAAFDTITKADPGFAPAFSALADTYLLAREFGGLSDDEAFAKARDAAQASLKLNPNLASAHRATGFLEYWWENNPAAAGRAFRRALELEPGSAQTHFWYGNILSDNGAHPAALRELSRARLLEPGSVAIQTDLAWAQWAAGMQTAARSSLDYLAQTYPDFAVVHECLAIIKLADGDYVGHVAEFSAYARLKGDASLKAYAEEQSSALRQGLPVLQRLILNRALVRVKSDIGRNHAWPAFLASVAEDRAQLWAILAKAEAGRETWGSAGTTSRIRSRWASDAEVTRLLDRRLPPPVE